MLGPFLTQENVDELLTAVTHKSKSEIVLLLAQRFPQADMPTRVRALQSTSLSAPTALLPALERVSLPGAKHDSGVATPTSSGRTDLLAPVPAEKPAARPKVTPLAPRRFALQLTMSQEMHDKLRHAQALLGHQIPSGDVVEVLHQALDALILKLEKRKFGATDRPHPSQCKANAEGRYIPAHVRRAVWKRDGEQCTFVSEAGQRCSERTRLEFDHMDEVARGGTATISRVRLRCRAHNQYAAVCTFGAAFMENKRRAAMEATTDRGSAA